MDDGLADAVNDLFAPGDQIMVAIPDDQYDFRSGSSLAAAHVSGVIALLLSVAPGQSALSVRNILLQSQMRQSVNYSVNACEALKLTSPEFACEF
jgi:subtilisin family serine protease